MKKVVLGIMALFICLNALAQKINNIKDFGAVGDGKTMNTKAIQNAIDDLKSKGKVIVPPGSYLTAPIFLKSGVELIIQEGAFLLGSGNRLDYGKGPASALINCVDQSDVSISGKGIIDGQGQEIVKDLFKLLQNGTLTDPKWKAHRPEEYNRPKLLEFLRCKNINVSGITMKNSAAWMQDYINCDHVVIDGIKIINTTYWNNDGIDIKNSSNVWIKNCDIDAADDAICLKSEDSPGWVENVYVENCTLRSSASAFKMGTGSYGGFRNIYVKGLNIYDTFRSAIAIEAVDGGFLENVQVENVSAKNTGCAIFIKLGHRNKDEKYSSLKNISIRNLRAEIPSGKPDMGYPIEGPPLKFDHNVFSSSITGISGHPVENVTLENIEIIYGGGAKPVSPRFDLTNLNEVPENISGYPEFSMFGELPSWGFYVRHVDGLKLRNINIRSLKEDFRYAMVFNEVNGLEINNLLIPDEKANQSIILKDVRQPGISKLNLPDLKKGLVIIGKQ